MKKLIVKSVLPDVKKFMETMEGIGQEVSPVKWQHERIYTPKGYQPGLNLPRVVLRTEVADTKQPAKYYLYSKRHIEDSGVDIVNYTGVDDYTEATGVVQELGFRKAAEISRQRQEIWLDERIVMYVDKVENLPETYLKIEAELAENESVEVLATDIFRILMSFGLEKRITKTYFELMK